MYKVVIVDDEKIVRVALSSILNWEEEGYEICATVASGASALKAIEQHSPHLLITDIEMPDMSGLELIRQAREAGYKGEIVILTNHQDFSYAVEALQSGAMDYVIKTDISRELLAKIVRKAYERIKEKYPKEKTEESSIGEDMELMKESLNSGKDSRLSGEYVMLGVFLRSYLTGTKSAYPEALKNILSEATRYSQKYIIPLTPDYVIMLLEKDKTGTFFEKKEAQFQKISELIQLYMNAECGFVCSDSFHTTDEMQECLKKCKDVSSHIFYDGFSTLVDVRKGYESGELPYSLLDVYMRLKLKIQESCCEDALEVLKQFIADCKKADVHPESARKACKTLYKWILADYALWMETAMASGQTVVSNAGELITAEEYLAEYKRLLNIISANKWDFSSSRYRKEIQEIDAFIKKNITQKITLAMISQNINMTENYVSRLFKTETGMNVITYINLLKLEYAKDVLLQKKDTIKEIAFTFGFDEVSYFNKLFSKTYGVSPSEYRELFQN